MTAVHPDADRPDERPLAELPAASISVYPDGPLIVRGDFALTDVDGRHLSAGRTVALCRCGRSAVKPFCDGSHSHARASRAGTARNTQDASDSSTSLD